jgi:hypothetical protein
MAKTRTSSLKSNIYEFKYSGSFQAIDAVTVLHSQLSFISLLTEIKNQIVPDSKLDIKLQGLEKGSLEVHQVIELAMPAGLFLVDNYETIKKVFSIFGDLFKVKEFLGNKKADKVVEHDNSVSLTLKVDGNNNNIIISPEAWKMYVENPKINDALIRTGKTLNESQDVEEVSVRRVSQEKAIAKIERKSFGKIKEENPYSENNFQYEYEYRQTIGIKRANLLPEPGRVLKWDVLYRNQNITIKISDQDFVSEITRGLRFGNGDKLLVDIKKSMKLDKTFNMYVESGQYEAVKVHKIIPREEQSALEFT